MRTASLCHVLRGQRACRQTLEDVKLGRSHDRAGQHNAEPALKDPRRKKTGAESYAFKKVVGNHTKFHWILPWKSRGRDKTQWRTGTRGKHAVDEMSLLRCW